MKFSRALTLGLFALALSVSLAGSTAGQQFASRSTAEASVVKTGLTTLYSSDPVSRSLCFLDGKEGGFMQNGKMFNRCSHIEFDGYVTGSLSVAIEGGATGRIIDLGTAADLRKQYRYQETVGNGQGFASITLKDSELMILKDYRKGTLQTLGQASQLFENNQNVASAEAKAGHIYLARITDANAKNLNLLVKLIVLSAKAGESVTFRWELLS
jgi:hypothetical protein